jgi:hypothetical protein
MLLEWLRRRDDALAGELKEYLSTEGDLVKMEEEG